jgi:hypothetical protein
VFNGLVEADGGYYLLEPASFVTTNTLTGESYTNEVWDESALGHTVLVVGYILAGSADDISAGGNTNWLIVRDNQSNTERNVVIPFDQLNTGNKTAWDNLIATLYINPSLATWAPRYEENTDNPTTFGYN